VNIVSLLPDLPEDRVRSVCVAFVADIA